MLYQPTNIYPSMTGALGNGVIDANSDLTVSWQVNGNSPMTAFQITIYANNTTSTQLFSTGKLTYGCPFYGVDYAGNVQMFHYTIYQQQLSLAQIENGRDYKIVIQQWWSDSDSVIQSSASVFRARSKPVLMVGEIPKPLTTRNFLFTASYTQQQSDALNWFRWQLASISNGIYSTIEDTGKIYGSAQLLFNYDGFITGSTYAVRCSVQTENGVEADTGWVNFFVQYETKAISGSIKTCQSTKGNGIKVTLPSINDIPGVSTGDVKLQDSYLTIPSEQNTSVKWSSKNGAPLSIKQPFDLFCKGKGLPEGDILSVRCKASVPGFEPTHVIDRLPDYPFGTHGAACVCTGGDVPTYVIITIRGTVSYSTDLENWSYSQIGNTVPDGWCGLAYGNSTYYAVSYGGKKIAKSSNLTDWTVETMDVGLTAICHGNGLFVAAGEGAVFTKTAEAENWTKTSVSFAELPTAIAYGEAGNTRYVIGTVGGEIYYSVDGTTWTLAVSDIGWISSITYMAGKFYAAGMTDSGILSSSDGITWTVAGSIPGFESGIDSISNNGSDTLYATGFNTGTYAYSKDEGETWSVFPCNAIEFRAFLFETGNANGPLLVGNGVSDGEAYVYAGGVTTVEQETTLTTRVTTNVSFFQQKDAIPNKAWRDVCYGNGKYVAVATDSNMAAYSTTGINWLSSTIHESATSWFSICYGNGVFVAVGQDYFATSTDAITWLTTPAVDGGTFQCVRFLNGKFYAVGSAIYRSSDGTTWEKCNVSTGNGYMATSITFGNGMYVCVTPNYTVSSYDGLNWSYTPMPQGAWRSVVFGNGVFVATGLFFPYSLYSYDGKTWSSASIKSGSMEGFGLCFGDGRFIAATTLGIRESIDGHTWNSLMDFSETKYTACCFGDGKFLAVGETADALLSGTLSANVDLLTNGGRENIAGIPYVQQWFLLVDGEQNTIGISWTSNGTTTANAITINVVPIAEITSITAGGAVSMDYIFISDGYTSEQSKIKFEDWANPYHPYDLARQFYADFTSDLNGDSFGQSYFTQFAVYRTQDSEKKSTHIFDSNASSSQVFIDAGARNNVAYQYMAVGLSDFDQSSTITSTDTRICVWDWSVLSCTEDTNGVFHPQKIFSFGKNLSSGDISNNNAPQILQNFTRYPTVQPSPFNYKNGTLTSLIGKISEGVYSDTVADRDEIMELSTTQNTLFLKNRKGDLLKIRIGAAIECGTMDNSPTQAQTVKLPWVEIGDATESRIIITENDGAWPN